MMERKKPIVKWLARLSGGLAILVFGFILLREGIPDIREKIPAELRSSLLLLLFAGFAYLFAWFREKEGGITLSIAGVLFGLTILYSRGTDNTWAFFLYALPFLLPGLMFWWLGNQEEND